MEQERLLRDLCDSSHDLIQSVSPDGRFLYVNRAWLTTLGYTRKEVAALRALDVIQPEHREHYEQVMQQAMEGKPVEKFEAVFVGKDGTRTLTQGRTSCRIENGRPLAIHGVFRDLTDRAIAEEKLDRLFDLSLDLLCIAGTDGFFKRINPAFERVLGYSREELLSRSFIEFVHPDDQEDTLQEVANLAEGKLVVDFKNRYRARDGSYRWLAWRAAPSPSLGRIYAVARDITQEKHDQELLTRQADELARSNADLEQFAYAASHDLQAPLRAVSTLAEWIGEGIDSDTPGAVRDHVEQLHSRVNRMRQLIADLLQYSRAGKRHTGVVSVDTGKLIDKVVSLLSPPEGFSVSTESAMPVLETEQTPLEQVLLNLIGNAIRHHDRSTGRVVVAAKELNGFFEFAIADDGPGVPQEAGEKVFEMFQRLKSQDEVEGTGIGLALVRRIVESVGGRVWCEPGSGRGATFRFTWPKHAADADGRRAR